MTFPFAGRRRFPSTYNKNPWNSADKSAGVTLSNSDQDATGNLSNAWACARATKGLAHGLWYWEVIIVATDTNPAVVAMGNGSFDLTQPPGATSASWRAQHGNALQVNGCTADYGSSLGSFAVNDIFGVAFNRNSGKAFVHRNGTYFNSGDPYAGTGSVISGMTSGSWYPTVGVYNSSNTIRIISDRVSFTYTPPAGFAPYGSAA